MSNKMKKQAKRKAKLKNRMKAQSGAQTSGDKYVRMALENDVAYCCLGGSLDEGMVNLMICKKATMEVVVLANFSIDLICLGVKNTFIQPGSASRLDDLRSNPDLIQYAPSDA